MTLASLQNKREKARNRIVAIGREHARTGKYSPAKLNKAFVDWWDAQKKINGGIPSCEEFSSTMGYVPLTAEILYDLCVRMSEHAVRKGRE